MMLLRTGEIREVGATGAVAVGLFIAYCQIHGLVAGEAVPIDSSARWGLIAGGPMGLLAWLSWRLRHRLARLVADSPGRAALLALGFFGLLSIGGTFLHMILDGSALRIVTPERPGTLVFGQAPFAAALMVKAAGNYCDLVSDGRSHLVRITLRELEARLRPLGFVRVHRSALVNAARIRSIGVGRRKGQWVVRLDGGQSYADGASGDFLGAGLAPTWRPDSRFSLTLMATRTWWSTEADYGFVAPADTLPAAPRPDIHRGQDWTDRRQDTSLLGVSPRRGCPTAGGCRPPSSGPRRKPIAPTSISSPSRMRRAAPG